MSIKELWFAKASGKYADKFKMFDDTIIVVTESGDRFEATLSPYARTEIDHERGLFSGILQFTVNFMKFNVMEELDQIKLFGEKTVEEIQAEIIEESKAEEKESDPVNWDDSWEEDSKLESEDLLNTNYQKRLPDPETLGGVNFMTIEEMIRVFDKIKLFVIAYKMEKTIVPLSTPTIGEDVYPLVFLSERTAKFVFEGLKKHPTWGITVANWEIMPILELTELEDIIALLVRDGQRLLNKLVNFKKPGKP